MRIPFSDKQNADSPSQKGDRAISKLEKPQHAET